MNQPQKLSQRVKELARSLGFHDAGIVRLPSLKKGSEAVDAWVAEGRHGTMKYLETYRDREQKLFEKIPDAASVLCLAVNYFQSLPAGRTAPQMLSGRVARYAWGRDYHEVIRARHEQLIEAMKREFGSECQAVSCVDIQPVAERYAAMEAGLGFSGKHTGLLNPRFGPWMFLSEIVTNLNLEPDAASPGSCGTCTHCVDKCPTGALDKAYQLDARKCIAYLTIEHKGVIPRELRPHIRDWVFGCDDCLEVCPFTSKEKETDWNELKADQGIGPEIMLQEIFQIQSNREYEKKFQGTAVLRAGLKQMIRNACLVLGNSGRSSAVPLVARALRHADAMVRIHAVWALGRLGTPEALDLIRNLRQQEKDPAVLDEIRFWENLL